MGEDDLGSIPVAIPSLEKEEVDTETAFELEDMESEANNDE